MKKPCDIAKGERTHNGYVRIKRKGKWVRAHREAWEKEHGPIPAGLFVLHRCDNRACREPEHLFLGTHQDNADDRVAKGRSAKGLRNGRGRLRPASVEHIRRSRLPGVELADIYGVHPATISKIRRGLTRL